MSESSDNSAAAREQREFDRKKIRERLRQEAENLKVRESSGDYKFDNPDLEHKTKRQSKVATLE